MQNNKSEDHKSEDNNSLKVNTSKIKKIAVITRTKNRPITLERAMKSILSQTESDWLHVIVNDGGEQSCVEQLMNKYSAQYKGRVKLIHNTDSLGMEAASNVGLKNSDSKYVLIHDDDDSLDPEFLAVASKALSECKVTSVKGVVTHTKQVFEQVTDEEIIFEYDQPFDRYLSAISLQKTCEVNKFMPISFLYERSVFEDVGYYDETLPVCGDWDFNIRFLTKFDILVVQNELANYHIRTNSNNKDYGNTVTDMHDKHMFYRSTIINKHVREDIASGKISLSHLLILGEATHDLANNTWVVARVIHHFRDSNSKIMRMLKRVFR